MIQPLMTAPANAPRRRPALRLRVAISAILPSLALLLAAELIAHIVCQRRFTPYETGIAIQGDSRWIDDALVFWSNRPFYMEYDGSAQYDEMGTRVVPGRARLPRKQPGELRVLLLGGSAIAGMGSNQNGDWLKITGVPSHPVAEAIDGFLEADLARALPGRRVRVLNAAVASHALMQSRGRYQGLREAVQPDWVISMDGVNDPASLAAGETVEDLVRDSWRAHPIHRFPIRQARALMRNSALAFLAGEALFFRSGIIRTPRNARQDPAILERWTGAALARPSSSPIQEQGTRAADAYLETLLEFDAELEKDGRRHLLLVQPHLSWRDPTRLGRVERAVWNYYFHSTPTRSAFLGELHARARGLGRPSIVSMQALDGWPEWVFVDYCHFSAEANRRIAAELARAILSDGAERPFESG
jgi:hypothetical protein